MHFSEVLADPEVLDIIVVDSTRYALVTKHKAVPGCISVLAAQLPAHLKTFMQSGYSERHRKSYSEVSGMSRWILYTYALSSLTPSRKQVFSHALMGTKARSGMLEEWRGEKLGRGAIVVPQATEDAVLAFFAHWNVPYTREVVLRG